VLAVEVTPSVFLAIAAAAFLIGLAKGGLSGLGPLLTLLVATVVPTKVAIGVLLPLLMVGDIAALVAHRGRWDRPILRRLLPGAAMGVASASLFLQSVSETGLRWMLAIFTMGFVVFRLAERFIRQRADRAVPGPRWAAAAGLASGVTSTVAHVGGPPVSVYLLAARVEPRPFVATTAALFFLINWMKVPGYLGAGLFEVDLMLAVWPVVVLIGPGILAGRWFVTVVDRHVFDGFILVSLMVGAILLLV
jgi:uncharacterized membrane protein YfcA